MGRLTLGGKCSRWAPLRAAVVFISVMVGGSWGAAKAEGGGFDRSMVIEHARKLAGASFTGPASEAAGGARVLLQGSDATKGKVRPLINWSTPDGGFIVKPLAATNGQSPTMEIYIVEDGRTRHYAFDRSAFEELQEKADAIRPGIGFAGIEILRAGSDGGAASTAAFHASGLYEAVGQGQVAGPTARPFKVRWSDKGEETLAVRTLWIEKPSAGASAIILHALLDAPSVAGACQFTVRPGVVTISDTECTIFARVELEQVGIGVMHAAHFIGPLAKPIVEDFRPAVHEASGLRMHSGKGEWIWRPLANRQRLEVSAFLDNEPKGFGLVQEARDFASYLDDENHWQRRPTVWLETLSEWGAGEVILQEIPANSPHNKNIVAYWRPRIANGAGKELSFAFRQYWGWSLPEKPRTAMVTTSRAGRAAAKPGDRRTRFLVQFAGGELHNAEIMRRIEPAISSSVGKISGVMVHRATEAGQLRVVFDLDAGGEPLSELRLVLIMNGAPKSETWLYRWTP